MIKERPAKGTKGVLISSFDGGFIFRVYHQLGNGDDFTDYSILHSDMSITIDDDEAMFKLEDTDNPIIDHSNATLGYK